jgi:ASCH domain
MTIKALSIVAPWGSRIAEGVKTREIRSWQPEALPIEDLLIVENNRRLTHPGETDPDGRAVAVVRVAEVHEWTATEAEAACAVWEPGWLAWALEEVRAIRTPFRIIAARRIYEVEVDVRLLPSFIFGGR